MVCRIRHGNPAVDGDKGVATQYHLVAELGDGDLGTVPTERRDLSREVAVGIGPGGRAAFVDTEAVVRAEADGVVLEEGVLDVEDPAEAGDDALVIALPADLRRGAVDAGVVGIGGSDA